MWVGHNNQLDPALLSFVGVPLTFATAILMVSTVRYHSFKELNLRGKVPFMVMLGLVLVFALIATDPPIVLFTAFLLYAISGPVLTLVQLRKHRNERAQSK